MITATQELLDQIFDPSVMSFKFNNTEFKHDNICRIRFDGGIWVRKGITCRTFRDCHFNSRDFSGTDFHSVKFTNCTFSHCSFGGSIMYGVEFVKCDMETSYGLSKICILSDSVNAIQCKINKYEAARLSICPDGEIIGWKKLADGFTAKLLIPADAKRSNALGRKCRASKAFVLGVFYPDGRPVAIPTAEFHSIYRHSFTYRVGEWVAPDKFDTDRWNECAGGIHFFLTKEEAEAY